MDPQSVFASAAMVCPDASANTPTRAHRPSNSREAALYRAVSDVMMSRFSGDTATVSPIGVVVHGPCVTAGAAAPCGGTTRYATRVVTVAAATAAR